MLTIWHCATAFPWRSRPSDFKLFDYPLALFELVRQNINMPRSYPRYATVFRRHLRYRGGQCRRLSVAEDCETPPRPGGGVLLTDAIRRRTVRLSLCRCWW